MGRKPIGDEAMSPAERKRRQRAKDAPAFDAAKMADKIVERLKSRYCDDPNPSIQTWGDVENKVSDDMKALIGELLNSTTGWKHSGDVGRLEWNHEGESIRISVTHRVTKN